MASPEELEFNKAFGQRLAWVRIAMDLSRPQLAAKLGMGVTSEMLKRYETRDESAFPLYLLPKLIEVSLEGYLFWIGDQPSKHWRFKVVKSSDISAGRR